MPTASAPRDEADSVPVWNSDHDDELVCCAAFDETPDVRTFVFAPVAPRRFQYDPGQFMNVEIDIGGETHTRSYTLASSPARPERVSITVKKIPGGLVSNHLHATLTPGARLRVAGPLGAFATVRSTSRKRLFISAGVGVTPLMSMARAAHDRAEDCDIVFIHSARSANDIVFHAEIELMAHRSVAFRPVFTLTGPEPPPQWPGERGRLTAEMLMRMCPDIEEREIFCCGPTDFMTLARNILTDRNFDMSRYHEESFVFSAGDEPAAAREPPQSTTTPAFQITFAKSGRIVPCAPDMFILMAARQAGVPLPSSCAKGLCGTCKSRKISGAVEMNHQGGIRPREIDNGLVLLCCSKPLGDVVIDR